MSKRIDLTGRIFERITILRFSHVDEKGKLKWIGVCNCNPEKEIIIGHHILYGNTRSCGCLKNETIRNKFFDLVGQKIGKLTILELISRNLKDKTKSRWLCRCECGNEIVRKHKSLLNNLKDKNSSCGKGKCSKNFEDLTGRIFGELEVLSYEGFGTSDKHLYKCKCSCGNIRIARGNNLLSGLTHHCFDCTKKNRPRGENHGCWNSNLSQEERELGKKREFMPENRIWRQSVYKRDNWTCQITGERGGNICAHHIKNWADNKELRFDPNNGITILVSLHILYHQKYGNRNTTLEQFEEFKREVLASC